MIIVQGNSFESLLKKLPTELTKIKAVGIFSLGMYLENEKGELIMLHDNKYGFIPFGIGIIDYGNSLINIKIDSNDDISISNKKLVIKNKLEVLLKPVSLRNKQSNMRLSNNQFLLQAISKLAKTEKGVMKNIINQSLKETQWSKRICKVLQFNDFESPEVLSELVGLGPGLTPSGDDFLIGYIYQKIVAKKDISKIKQLVEQLLNRTTAVSKAFITATMNGESFSLFDEVCYAKDEDSLNKAIEQLLEVGNNSGADILCGMCFVKMKVDQ
jgi:hypothetical protein